MTKREYIKQVGRHLQCCAAKKKEIEKQLDSHIEIALGEGRNLEEILAEMGDPEELAGEFNENLDEKEKKTPKKKKLIPIILVSVFLVLAAVVGIVYWMLPKGRDIYESRVFDAGEVEALTEEVIRLFGEEEYENLEGYMTQDVLDALEQMPLDTVRRYIGEDWGECLGMGKIYMAEVQEKGKVYAMAQANVSYENVSVTFTLTFNADMQLYGFYVK